MFIPGLDLSAAFYAELVRPIAERVLGSTPHSAALIGSGSEVQGFDTERSTDHSWGPRLQLFLDAETRAAQGAELEAALEASLPETFRGYAVRFPLLDFEPPRLAVPVVAVDEFFADHLDGADPLAMATPDWLRTPAQVFRELTAGRVFHDGLGILGRFRAALAWYPDDVWRYVLACQWLRIEREEPFVGRCGDVGDDLGSALIAARQIRDLMKLFLLMARVYPPYGKWLGTAFSRLPIASAVTPAMRAALAAGSWQEREKHLSPVYEAAARAHNELGLTPPIEPTVRPFWGRPFLVLRSDRFADALLATVRDPAIGELPTVGAVDQFVDSTDLLDRRAAQWRRRYLTW